MVPDFQSFGHSHRLNDVTDCIFNFSYLYTRTFFLSWNFLGNWATDGSLRIPWPYLVNLVSVQYPEPVHANCFTLTAVSIWLGQTILHLLLMKLYSFLNFIFSLYGRMKIRTYTFSIYGRFVRTKNQSIMVRVQPFKIQEILNMCGVTCVAYLRAPLPPRSGGRGAPSRRKFVFS